MKVEQLRDLFGLDAAEELYGDYSCAHTKPRWGSQFLHGQLYVFSTCMVFHANLIAVVKAVRIYFKDVRVIRKRSFLRMPNTIALTRHDASGTWHEEVFTSFVFASRRHAYNTMVQRWREINPTAAAAHLDQVPLPLRPRGSLTGHRALSAALLDSDSEGAEAQVEAEDFPRPLQQLLLSASLADAALQPPDGVELKEVARQQLRGDAQQLAQVLLANTSGFLPQVMLNQGNQLVSLTPWQVVPVGHCSLPPGSLQRTFRYIFTDNGAWGTVRSVVVQQQVLQLFDDGRLVLSISQRMPELPAGVGKALHVIIQWVAEPGCSRAGATSPHQGISTPEAAAPTSGFTTRTPTMSSTADGEGCAAAAVADAGDDPRRRCCSEPHLSAHGSGPSTPRSLPPAALAEAQFQHLQHLLSVQPGRPPDARSPFVKLSEVPLGPDPRPGSFMGLAGPTQLTVPEGHLQGSSSDELSAKHDLQHALLAVSCPDLVKDPPQPDHSWSPGLHPRPDASSSRGPAPAYSMPVGNGEEHPHLAKLTLKKNQLLAGLKCSLKDLQSPLIRLKKAASTHSTASTGSSSKMFGATGPAGHSESTMTGSVLGSVDEEPEVESVAFAVTGPGQAQQQQEVCVPAPSLTAKSLSRGSRGRDEAGGQLPPSLTNPDNISCSNGHKPLDSQQQNGQVICGMPRRCDITCQDTVAASGRHASAAALRVDTVPSQTGSDHGHVSDQPLVAASPSLNNTAGAAQHNSHPVEEHRSASGRPCAPCAESSCETGNEALGAMVHNSHVSSSGNKDSPGCSSSSGVVLKVSVGIQWVKWHIAQKKVTDDTLAATRTSQQAILSQALSWLEDPSQRQMLAAVMPQAVKPSPGGRKHHRRSGSAGSAGRVAAASRTLSVNAGTTHRLAVNRHPVTCRPREGLVQQVMGLFAGAVDVVGAALACLWSALVQQRTGVVLVMALLLSAGHMLLLWKAIQLMSVLVDKLDSLATGTACMKVI